jgi:Domain of unknown function (DUF4394)
VAVAYTNPDTDLQTNTVLHDLDVNRAADADPGRVGDVLAIQVPPNGGVLNTVGRLGIDADDFAASDIGPDNEALAAILLVGSEASRLYFVDLASGDATDLGRWPSSSVPRAPRPGSRFGTRKQVLDRSGEGDSVALPGSVPRCQPRLTETIRESPGSSMVTP